MATPLEQLEKEAQIDHLRKYLSSGEKMVKIGAVDPEINH